MTDIRSARPELVRLAEAAFRFCSEGRRENSAAADSTHGELNDAAARLAGEFAIYVKDGRFFRIVERQELENARFSRGATVLVTSSGEALRDLWVNAADLQHALIGIRNRAHEYR